MVMVTTHNFCRMRMIRFRSMIFSNTTAIYILAATIYIKLFFPDRNFMLHPFHSFLTGSKSLTTMGRISHSNDGCFPDPQLTSPMHHPHIRHLVFGLNLLFNFTNHFFSHRHIGGIFQGTHSFPLMMITYCSDKDADSTTFRKMLNIIKILHPESSLLDSGKLF